jgi:hypothetical protein
MVAEGAYNGKRTGISDPGYKSDPGYRKEEIASTDKGRLPSVAINKLNEDGMQ